MEEKPTVTNREFNTSGPNWPDMHYTLPRAGLVNEGVQLVNKSRYFAIWAPRQGGKSTYFELLTEALTAQGYKVATVNFENHLHDPPEKLLDKLQWEAQRGWGTMLNIDTITAWEGTVLKADPTERWVLVIDEIEGVNPDYLPDLLHTIRSLYHSRRKHVLKSVILVGVSNLAGVIQDQTSPFNIADSFVVPYFTRQEVFELLGQHEAETTQSGQPQVFAEAVKDKIYTITAGQPGLVNGIAHQLVRRYPTEPELTLEHYHQVENWYIEEALEKNTANIVQKARHYRKFIEELLYLEKQVKFLIANPAISFLYTQGVVGRGKNGEVTFQVPLYKKRLEQAFALKINGEVQQFYLNGFNKSQGITQAGRFNWPAIIGAFQDYVQRRGFRYFREKDPHTGQYYTLKEAATVYAFEAFVQTLLTAVNGRSYLEAHAGLGNSDLILNVGGQETIIEAKIYHDEWHYEKGLKQLSHYAQSAGALEALYLVFINKGLTLPESITAQANTTQTLGQNTPLHIYHLYYDTEKDF